MKKREKFTKLEFWLTIVCVSVLALIILGFASVYAEDFQVVKWYGDTYDTVRVIYYISGVLQDTAIYTNASSIDTTFSGIAAGQHKLIIQCVDASGTQRAQFEENYSGYQSGLTLTSADYDSISAGINTAGTGQYAVDVFAIDTSSAPDSAVWNAKVMVRSIAGNAVVPKVHTSTTGTARVNLDSGAYVFVVSAPGYYFAEFTDTITAANDSLPVKGYNSFSANKSHVYGSLGSGWKYARVTITMPELINNHCDSTLLSERSWSAYTGADGGFEIEVPYSSCFVNGADTVKYKLTISRSNAQPISYDLLVPDTNSYKVFW